MQPLSRLPALRDPHAPHLRALLEVLPAEAARQLGFELVAQRARIVVVDQHNRVPGREHLERAEDRRMFLARRYAAPVQPPLRSLMHDALLLVCAKGISPARDEHAHEVGRLLPNLEGEAALLYAW